MSEILKKVYHRLSGIPLVHWLGRRYLDGSPLGNLKALKRLRKTSRIQRENPDKTRPIRVAFLVQNIQVWIKIRSVYAAMREDSRFETCLLAIQDISDPEDKNETYGALRLRYPEAIPLRRAANEPESLILSGFHPDFVFYNKSYDQYLPSYLRSGEVSEYAKVCYCTYCFFGTLWAMTEVYSKTFARNVSLFFADTPLTAEYNRRRFPKGHAEDLMRSLAVGYPMLGEMAEYRRNDDPRFHILWTPRWSTASEVYGSNFFAYKDCILAYAQREKDVTFTFRPHPLLFYHFLETGQLTQEQMTTYLENYRRTERIRCDQAPEYLQQFADADVLVSDISSMVMEFSFLGKPLIFCDTGGRMDGVYARIVEGVYMTHSWEEVEQTLNMLRRGEDPMKEQRLAIRREVFGDHLDHIPQRFMAELEKSFRQ